jgi:hypothetical protein
MTTPTAEQVEALARYAKVTHLRYLDAVACGIEMDSHNVAAAYDALDAARRALETT